MTRLLLLVGGVLAAIAIGSVAAAGTWRVFHPAPVVAAPLPSPTPCRILYVGDDGMVSCLALPSYGMEPFP